MMESQIEVKCNENGKLNYFPRKQEYISKFIRFRLFMSHVSFNWCVGPQHFVASQDVFLVYTLILTFY